MVARERIPGFDPVTCVVDFVYFGIVEYAYGESPLTVSGKLPAMVSSQKEDVVVCERWVWLIAMHRK